MTGRRPTYAGALTSTSFRCLVLAHGLGATAQVMLTLATGLEVLARTGSGPWLSVTVALGFVPYALFSGLAGVVADRWSRSLVLAASAWLRVLSSATLCAVLLLDGPAEVLVAATALAAVAATPSYPALVAGARQSVPDRELPAANALATAVETLAWIAGPGVVGLVLLAGGGPFTVNVACLVAFLLAGVAALRARLPRPAATPPEGAPRGPLAGLRVLRQVRRIRPPMTMAALNNFLFGYVVVAAVLMVEDGDERRVGAVNAALTVGALLALLTANRLSRSDRPRALGAVMAAYAGAVVLVGFSGAGVGGMVLLAVVGGGSLLVEVIAVTAVQRWSPASVVGRVVGVYDQLNIALLALGSLLAGPLAAVLGARQSVTAVGLFCLAGGLLIAWWANSTRPAPAAVTIPGQRTGSAVSSVTRGA